MFKNMSLIIPVLSRTPNLIKELQNVLPNISFYDIKDPVKDDKIKEGNILIADYDLIGPHLYNLPNLKWLQGTWAGVEKLLPHVKKDQLPQYPISRFSGQYFGRLMSEYVVANVVNFERDIFEIRSRQMTGEWYRKGKITKHRAIFDLTFGILGMGNIATEVGQTLNFMGAKVLGYGRKDNMSDYQNIDHIKGYFTKKSLPEMLSNCDYLINILPNTPETQGLLNESVLESCKERGTVFINIGRGTIISETSLINALENKWISGAILDVFEKEPLDKDCKLWKMPQVFITPHVSGMSRAKDIAAQFKQNLTCFLENKPLPNLIDFGKGY